MMTTDHEMRMYALKLFEILEAVDHTLSVHGKVDCGTPLHDRIKDALSDGNEDPSGQRREAVPGWMGDISGTPFGPSDR